MAVILAYGSPALGHLYPMGALLVELVARGHQVHVRTMAGQVATMRRFGVNAEAVDPRIESIIGSDWLAGGALGVLKNSIDVLCRRAVFEVDDLRSAVAQVRPDAIIVDANCWGAVSAADAGDVAWSIFSPFTPYLQSRGTPPFGPGLRPLSGVVGATRDATLRPVVRHLFDRPILPRINALRAGLNVRAIKSVDELMRRSPLLLAVGGEPFEYPHPDWGDAVHFIGACVFEPSAVPAPRWLPDIEGPVVLVNTSSIAQADAKLGETVLRAFADQPVHVVATFPAGIPAGLCPPPNATVRQFLPHGPVLDRAICVVTHGGMGTTVKALDRGVPVCVVPFARDQAEVARRVQVAEAGTRLPPRRLTPARLRRAVHEAVSKAPGAARVAAGFAATGGVTRGAELIEQRLLLLARSAAAGRPLPSARGCAVTSKLR